MSRTRAWRRHKNYTKAKRKYDIDHFYRYGSWYPNLHQYSKNKIHCSCPMCRRKTKNYGAAALFNGAYNPSLMDRRRRDSMNESEVEYKEKDMKYVRFYGGNGYNNCWYEEYLVFPEGEYDEDELNDMSSEYAILNAEDYEWVARRYYDSWEIEDEEDYYNSVSEYCGWEYITEEEYKENRYEEC